MEAPILLRDDYLQKMCRKHLQKDSKFHIYANDALVFISITGKHSYAHDTAEGKQVIIPGNVYPMNGSTAKGFELEMAFQKVECLDMTANPNSVANIIQGIYR